MSNDTLSERGDASMDEYLRRAITRGTQIRRRRKLVQITLPIVAVGAVLISLATLGRNTPQPGGAVDAAAYRLVSWSRVGYPGLNVANAQYPSAMGCGPGFPAEFPVDVQQVSYVRPAGVSETLALVLVHCQSPTPTPSSLYAFEPGSSAVHPRLLQVLLAPPNPRTGVLWYADHFQLTTRSVTLHARGVTQNAAICCPDTSATMHWRISGRQFIYDGPRLPGR